MVFNKKKVVNVMFWSLGFLLAIRLIFFLKDGSSDLVESILIWVIFSESLLFAGLLLYPTKMKPKEAFIMYQDKLYLSMMIFLLEIGFLIENQLPFNPIYLFSLFLIILLVALFSLFLPKKVSRIFDISVIILYTFYVFAQDNYYRIFDDFFSFREAGNFNEGIEFAEGMYVFKIIHVYFIVLAIVVLILYLLHNKISHLEFNKGILKTVYALPLFLFFLVNINAQFPVNPARLHLSDHYLYVSTFSKERFVSRFGTYNLLLKDGASSLIPSFSTQRDMDYIEDYYEDNDKLHSNNEYTGMFEGKNLIFIVGESFDSIVVSEELTPNIYKLKSEGIDFQNHFTPVFPRTTCDSEVIFNTSIIPSIQDGPTCYVYNENTYSHSIAELFNSEDYLTNAFHNNYKEFYTRDFVYEGFGYDNFYGQHELGLSEDEKRYDSVFYDFSEKYSVFENDKFFSFLLTISGHSPYDLSNLAVEEHYDAVNAHYGDTAPESIKMYIASQIETDVMIGKIFDDLESKGILEDTVIILTNDHYPYVLDQGDYESYKNIDEDFMKTKGVMYLWASGIDHVEVTKLTSSFDFLPTIVNMFNLDGDYNNYVGNDIFSNDYDPLVYFKDFSIYDGINHYELSSTKDYVNYELIQVAIDYYKLSRKLLKVDYFKDH